MSLTVRSLLDTSLAEAPLKPREQESTVENKVSDARMALADPTVTLSKSSDWSYLRSRDYFLDTDAVDKTAEPGDDFAALLTQLLPMNIKGVVLEFWIEKDGRTVEVRCIEGACSDDVLASLPKLTDLAFTSAVKNGEVVANRKVIQIEPKTGFDF